MNKSTIKQFFAIPSKRWYLLIRLHTVANHKTSIYLIYHIFPSTQHTSFSLPLHDST